MAASPFLAEIMLFAGNFAPRGFALCDGQILAIAQNTALFSLLGTTYGGNGQTTFALPDLRGRAPIHAGQGPGLSARFLGEVSGEEAHTLLSSEMPAHSHTIAASSQAATKPSPTGNYPAAEPTGQTALYNSSTNTTMAANAINSAGGGQPHNNMQPYLVLNYCIALQGIFPSRN